MWYAEHARFRHDAVDRNCYDAIIEAYELQSRERVWPIRASLNKKITAIRRLIQNGLAVCPQDDCLTVTPHQEEGGSLAHPPAHRGDFSGLLAWDRLSDHWQSKVAPVTFRQMYQVSTTLKHPKY